MKPNSASKLVAVGLILLSGNIGLVSGAETPKVAPAPSTVGKITDGLQLIAWLDKTKVAAGEPVVLHFALRNMKKEEVTLVQHPDNLPERDFHLEVKSAPNKPVPLTEYGKLVPHLLACERIKVPVKSGQEVHNQLCVSRLHDLTKKGKYFITVSVYLLDGKREGKIELHPVSPLDSKHPLTRELVSNAIQLEVT